MKIYEMTKFKPEIPSFTFNKTLKTLRNDTFI